MEPVPQFNNKCSKQQQVMVMKVDGKMMTGGNAGELFMAAENPLQNPEFFQDSNCLYSQAISHCLVLVD